MYERLTCISLSAHEQPFSLQFFPQFLRALQLLKYLSNLHRQSKGFPIYPVCISILQLALAYPSPGFSLLQHHPEMESKDEDQPSSPPNRHSACAMDVSLSAAASASTSITAGPRSSKYYCCDVFINHRGPDSKMSLASSLYYRLNSYGLDVFLDQPELQQGYSITSQIECAIRSASVHVAIFSPRYAESSWCLKELVHMLESKRTIIPIFYHVKPAELRWTRGGDGQYAQAFEELEKKMTDSPHGERSRYDSTTIGNWRTALSQVAEKSGFELETFKGDEAKLIEEVVQRVLGEVEKLSLNVAKYPIGLAEKVKDFENTVLLPQQQSGKRQIVGIVGLGGVGKTTLAKEFFNQKRSFYGASCFLSNVGQNAAAKGLNLLQSEILSKLIVLDKCIYNVHEGKTMLNKHLSSCHALIILDDVEDVDQVDELLPAEHVLRIDSLILITCRDENVLSSLGVEAIYKLTGLNPQRSRKLFCFHAFARSHPWPEFESVVEEFLEACCGLPLALKVIGALLRGKDISHWKDQFVILQKKLPDSITQSLKISYDALEEQERQIFLDIACFFIGENKDMAIKIWDGLGWRGSFGFRNLESKCLVEVDSGNIDMHNLLRDLGRGIEESSTLRLRLWKKPQSIDDLLHNSLYGLENVRGLRLVDGDIDPVLPRKMPWYKRWSHELFHSKNTRELQLLDTKLQLLDTKGGLLKLLLKRVHLPNLVWLRWSKCPDYSLSSWVPMKNLRVLHVSGSVLETLWPDEAPLLLQAPLQLRELVIVAPLSRLPKSIGLLKKLELIVLSYRMSNLERLPDEFCHLQSLKHFELTNCSKIKSLPDSFGDLKNLQHIDLSHSYYLKTLPESFSDLFQLKHLDLSYCYNLTMSSEALGNIRTLEYIDISYCTKIETLPPQVARQLSLQNLYFSGTHFKELPVTIGDMRDLEFLVLECRFLEMLPYSVGNLTNLKELTLRHCNALKRLPDSVGLLNRVIVYDCGLLQLSLENVEGEAEILRQSKGKGLMSDLDSSIDRYMPRLPLRINSETENLRQSKGKRVLSNPDSSIYRHMPWLPPRINREIPEVSFPGLQHLLVESCDDLVEVGTLPNTLIALQLKRCCNLRKIEGLGTLAELQILDISQCTELEELPSIETLLSLGELYACGCVKLKSIRGFAQLEKLGVLDVSECSELEELQGVEHLSYLVMLKATQCPKLQWDEQLPLQLTSLLRESSIQASSWPWRSRQVMCKALLLIRFTCNSHAWPWRSRLVMCMAILWVIN